MFAPLPPEEVPPNQGFHNPAAMSDEDIADMANRQNEVALIVSIKIRTASGVVSPFPALNISFKDANEAVVAAKEVRRLASGSLDSSIKKTRVTNILEGHLSGPVLRRLAAVFEVKRDVQKAREVALLLRELAETHTF